LRSTKMLDGLYIKSASGCINNECRPIIFHHPVPSNKSAISFINITIPKNAVLKFGIGLDPQVWSPEKGDGALFEIEIQDDGANKTIFSEYIDPKNHVDQRKWNNYELDLSSVINKKSTISFKTACGPNNDCTYDWAWWGSPLISS